jgi:multiple sugar transport system substrate-binding protein
MKKSLLWFIVVIMSVSMMATFSLVGCKTTTAAETTAVETTAAETTAAETTAVETTAAETVGAIPSVLTMPEQIAGGRPVTITVANCPPSSQPILQMVWKEQAARFKELYPNVILNASDYTYSPDSFPALVAAHQVPTLFLVYLTDPGTMIDQGVCADLTSIFEAQGLSEVYNPTILDLVSRDGKVYGIPWNAYSMGLVYNINMLKDAGFNAPPTTWDEFTTMAGALTDRDAGVEGFNFCTGEPHQAGWHTTVMAFDYAGFKSSDVAIKQADGTYKAGFDNTAMLSTLNFIKELRWTKDVLPRENLAWDTNNIEIALGRSAMSLFAGDCLSWIMQNYPDTDMSQFGFAPLPLGPDGKSTSLGGGNIFMVSADATPDEVEAAAYYRLWTYLDPGEIVAGFEAGAADPSNVVGAPLLPVYVGEFQDAFASFEQRYANLPVENYKPYKDAMMAGTIVIVAEGQVAFQEYYALIGGIVSEILIKENADTAALLTRAAKTYQTDVLDLLQK